MEARHLNNEDPNIYDTITKKVVSSSQNKQKIINISVETLNSHLYKSLDASRGGTVTEYFNDAIGMGLAVYASQENKQINQYLQYAIIAETSKQAIKEGVLPYMEEFTNILLRVMDKNNLKLSKLTKNDFTNTMEGIRESATYKFIKGAMSHFVMSVTLIPDTMKEAVAVQLVDTAIKYLQKNKTLPADKVFDAEAIKIMTYYVYTTSSKFKITLEGKF